MSEPRSPLAELRERLAPDAPPPQDRAARLIAELIARLDACDETPRPGDAPEHPPGG